MHAIAGRAGRGVEGRKRGTDAGIVFQRVEPAVDGNGRVLERVAKPHASSLERAERAGLVDAAQAQARTQAAAFAADKPAVRKIVPRGKAAGATVLKAREAGLRVRALPGIQIAAEAEPARRPIGHRGSLGVSRSPAQTKRRYDKHETQSACKHGHPHNRQVGMKLYGPDIENASYVSRRMGGAQRYPSIADDGTALTQLMGFAEGSALPMG